jgi:homoserine/homoserine lactone efflux protein
MDVHTWLIYLLAATGLSLSPGPNGLLALTHGALHGRRKALYTVLGGACGFLVVIALSMFGIGALLQASLGWLTVMKWVGGAYLVWLGIQVWRSPPIGLAVEGRAAPRAGWSLFRQGALSALTNPKGLLFFAAFLPQFIDRAGGAALQGALLGVVFVAVAACTDSAYVLAANLAGTRLGTSRRFETAGRYAAAATYFGLGLFTAATGSRSGR